MQQSTIYCIEHFHDDDNGRDLEGVRLCVRLWRHNMEELPWQQLRHGTSQEVLFVVLWLFEIKTMNVFTEVLFLSFNLELSLIQVGFSTNSSFIQQELQIFASPAQIVQSGQLIILHRQCYRSTIKSENIKIQIIEIKGPGNIISEYITQLEKKYDLKNLWLLGLCITMFRAFSEHQSYIITLSILHYYYRREHEGRKCLSLPGNYHQINMVRQLENWALLYQALLRCL